MDSEINENRDYIKGIVGRLRDLDLDECWYSSGRLSAICKAVHEPRFGGWTAGACEDLRLRLLDVCEAALEMDDAMPLPVDADGKPIHLGDEMEYRGEYESKHGTVEDISYHVNGGVCARLSCGINWYNVADLSHYHAPTVEDVLRECVTAYMDTPLDDSNESEFFAQFAAKLRLRDGE